MGSTEPYPGIPQTTRHETITTTKRSKHIQGFGNHMIRRFMHKHYGNCSAEEINMVGHRALYERLCEDTNDTTWGRNKEAKMAAILELPDVKYGRPSKNTKTKRTTNALPEKGSGRLDDGEEHDGQARKRRRRK